MTLLPGVSQSAPPTIQPAAQPIAGGAATGSVAEADAAYLKLVDAASARQGAKAPPDWCEIRRHYPGTSFYRAHGGTDLQKMTAEAGQKVLFDKTPAAVASFRDFMRNNAGSAGAHFYAAYLFDWNSDLVRQKMDPLLPDFGHGIDYIDAPFEKQAAAALLDCIMSGAGGPSAGHTDGRTPSSAYEVISVDEIEIVVDKYYRVEPVSFETHAENGQVYNALTVRIPGNPTPVVLYFRPSRALLDGEMAHALSDRMARRKAAAAASGSAPAAASVPTPNAGADAAYLAAAGKAFADPAGTDGAGWGRLRTLYAASSYYKPDAGFLVSRELGEAEKKAGTEKTPAAVAAYRDLLRRHYGAFTAHASALHAYETYQPAYIDKAAETAALRALIASVVHSGDGASKETAFHVIDTEEEYALLASWFRVKPTGQKLLPDHGHFYDVLDFKDPKTGAAGKMFFNVDTMMARPN